MAGGKCAGAAVISPAPSAISSPLMICVLTRTATFMSAKSPCPPAATRASCRAPVTRCRNSCDRNNSGADTLVVQLDRSVRPTSVIKLWDGLPVCPMHFFLEVSVMAYKVNKVEMWTREIEDRVGGLAGVLQPIAEAGVDLEIVVARRHSQTPGKG